MSLNWSIEDVKDSDKISMDAEKNGIEAHKTHALLWATLSVDLPGITQKNVDEFHWRVTVLEKFGGGPLMYRFEGTKQEDYLFTKEDIARRVGLSTNVSTKSRTHWVARIVKQAARNSGLDEKAQKALRKEILATAPAKGGK